MRRARARAGRKRIVVVRQDALTTYRGTKGGPPPSPLSSIARRISEEDIMSCRRAKPPLFIGVRESRVTILADLNRM